jgi:hypothetical protein
VAGGFASLGFASIVGAVLAYFAARHALDALVDLTIYANAAFVDRGGRARSLADLVHFFGVALDWYEPWSYAFLGVVAIALVRARMKRDRELAVRYARPLAWAACAYVDIATSGSGKTARKSTPSAPRGSSRSGTRPSRNPSNGSRRWDTPRAQSSAPTW